MIANPFDEVQRAVNQARELDSALNSWTPQMVRLVLGRLRHASEYDLRTLKRELQDFNAVTGKWKHQ